MAGTVWGKFFWSDWSNDPALRVCSLAAQGLWMRMLCVAAEADPTGYVTVNGRPLDGQDLARLTGVSVPEVETLLSELDRNGVFSRNFKGAIYSRRMVRDEKKKRIAQKFGKSGGNPSLRKQKEILASDNPPLIPTDNTHKPEARYQKEKSELRSPKKATRLSEDWTLPDELREYAQSQGMPPEAISREAENFRDYWSAKPGKDGTKADWPATWRMWVRRACERQGYSPPPAKTNGHGPSPPKSKDEAEIRLKAGRDRGQWPRSQWGPAPGEEGCLIPPDLIQPTDRGWGEWERRGS